MEVRSSKRRPGRSPMKGFLIVAAAFALVLTPGVVLARSSYGTAWSAAHPGSTSYTSAGCALCHGSVGDFDGQWNSYGQAVKDEFNTNGRDIVAAIATVDAANSDGDPTGSTNAAEATANAQPGWRYGPNNTVYDGSGVPTTGQLPPAGITGLLDPVTLVTISDTAFTPSAAALKLLGSVQWVPGTSVAAHNVSEVHNIFTSGAAKTALYYNRIFSAGTFAYHDDANLAMTGSIKVKPKTTTAPTGVNFTLTWASAKTNTGTRFNVQYRIGTGAWKNWLLNTTAKKAVFGANVKPIVPVKGTTYGFRVQSGTGTVWSGYSPIVSFKA